MWLALRYFADQRVASMLLEPKLGVSRPVGAPSDLPDLGLIVKELGSAADGILYRRLLQHHPDVVRGPDEEMGHHFSRLKRADAELRARNLGDAARRAEDPRLTHGKPATAPPKSNATWVTSPAPNPTPSSSLGLPQRIPGWFTGDAIDAAPPDWGTPRMPQRTPGATPGPWRSTAYPPQQTHEEWLRGLADKGIFVDQQTGRRMTPEQMQPPQRPRRGHDIWSDFITSEPYAGRHRAARVVTAYISGLLANVQDALTGDGWTRGPGSGEWYQKKMGDKLHVLVREPDGGWIHNTGPLDGTPDEYGDPEVTGQPMSFMDLQSALMHAHRGKVQVGFKPPPPPGPNDHARLSSWSEA